jgi:nucleoside phosphorylase
MASPHILLVCATRPEWNEFKEFDFRLSQKESWGNLYKSAHDFGGKHLSLVQVGIGWERSEAAGRAIVSSEFACPDSIVHFGLAGGLDKNLKTGDIILPQSFCAKDEDEIPSLSPLSLPGVSFGKLFTSRTVLSHPMHKLAAGIQHQALAVDMESYPFALQCQQKNIPYLSIRGIFDPLDWDLTHLDEAQSITEKGDVRLRRVGVQIIKNPKLLMSLPKYQRALSQANKAIKKCVINYLQGL